jgi:hypothetical protein
MGSVRQLHVHGECETTIVTLTGSTYTVWQFTVFWVLLQSYPDDDNRKRDRNVLVINSVWKKHFVHVHWLVLLHKSWSFRGNRIQWNFLWQTGASGCKGFPTFRFYQTTSTSSRWGRSSLPKRRKTLTSWRGCLPKKISFYYVSLNIQSFTVLYYSG